MAKDVEENVDDGVVVGAYTEKRGPVGWIIMRDYDKTSNQSLRAKKYTHIMHAVGQALHDFRHDPEVRCIVLTGENDGEFYRVARGRSYDDKGNRDRLNPIKRGAPIGFSAPNAMELFALIEKPIIARVNGDTIGLGQAFFWGCDIIIAREDAIISDVHTGMQTVVDSNGEVRGFPWAVTPGDGAQSFLAMFMPPTLMKEYLFTSPVWSMKRLEQMNIVNYAVPADQLDAKVDEMVEKILKRPSFVLAHAKRVAQKRLIENWNLHQDLAMAYEHLDFFTHAAQGAMD
ncbi:enoyl-CoA hydratase/isomerase family protein [Phenylobacterium sp. J367]|uniref:enoyl-CoA hydratase/isomerase family protein n=1 Tax=Phenylobacterium sp. J367 TaxID=2898435 RepID=UPI002150F51C|nr:enoyl-CoA hydratase/isomerase family protein [Phenylobacterium sp. J367]MCR5879556.1 enoyl-CoA hydratase/isomerase family protein [Phenylobacterium sp. J367]